MAATKRKPANKKKPSKLPPALPGKAFGPTQSFLDWLDTLPKPKESQQKEV